MVTVLHISSDWTNVVNAIIFEILLITIIFFLTSDVCARLNYLALADGSVQDLVVMSPPLVGGGVISTSRQRSLLMIAMRSFAIFLIFGTALTIDGDTIPVLLTNTKTVYSPANLSNPNTTLAAVTKLVNLRYTCTVSYNNSMVFGRLDEDGYCETDGELLKNAISIHSDLEPTSVMFSSGCQHTTIPYGAAGQTEYVVSMCEQDSRKATAFCFHFRMNGVVQFSECVASLQLSTTKFAVCEYFDDLLEGPSVSISADCHPASNLGAVQDFWPSAMGIAKRPTIIDMIAAVSVASTENREVHKFEERDVTRVHHMWFLCFVIKLALLVLLGVLSIRLRSKGARRILNDDRALLALLKQKLDDWIGVSNTQEQPTIYLHMQTNQDGERNVWASTMPNYNATVNNPQPAA